jgi:RNA polymerase sigma-B factor
VKAVDRFDPCRGVAFSSFAVPTIVGEVKRHFRDHTWMVRPPRRLQELSLRVEQATGWLSSEFGRPPSVQDIADHLGCDDEEVLEALQARRARASTSLSAPAGDDEDATVLGELLGDEDDGLDRAEDHATLTSLFDWLTPRERVALRLRYEEDMTQAQIGEVIGVSQMQVSRIIDRSIERLRSVADGA